MGKVEGAPAVGARVLNKRSIRGGLLFVILGALLVAVIAVLSWNVAFQKGYELGQTQANTEVLMRVEQPELPDISAHIVASDHADLAFSKTHEALQEASTDEGSKPTSDEGEGDPEADSTVEEDGGTEEVGGEGEQDVADAAPTRGKWEQTALELGDQPAKGGQKGKKQAVAGQRPGQQGPVEVRRLQSSMRREDLTHVFLEYFRRNPGPRQMTLNFKGPECPRFAAAGANFTGVEACWNKDMVDAEWEIPRAPINCPDVMGPEGQLEHNPECTHLRKEFLRHEKLAAQVFVLRNVYVNSGGQVFNATRHYDRNGCGSDPSDRKFVYGKGTKVTVFREVVNLAHWNAWQFYHGLIEMLPQFFVLARILPLHRGIPVAHRQGQREFMDTIGHHIVGLTAEDLNIHEIRNDELIFAERLIQPVFQYCARPSRTLWSQFRRHHLVPPDGLPMFRPDFSLRRPRPSSMEELSATPSNWTVVFAKRYGSRGLVQNEEMEAALRAMLPADRLTVFDGNLPILEARALFNRALLFVAVHGAAMTNMIFMPFNASVLELRPRDYPNPCYHHVAEVCGLRYYLLFGDGNKETSTSVNFTQAQALLNTIVSENLPGL